LGKRGTGRSGPGGLKGRDEWEGGGWGRNSREKRGDKKGPVVVGKIKIISRPSFTTVKWKLKTHLFR